MQPRIFVLGRHDTMLAQALGALRGDGFDADGGTDDASAERAAESGAYAAIVIGGGVDAVGRARVRDAARRAPVAPAILEVSGLPAMRAALRSLSTR